MKNLDLTAEITLVIKRPPYLINAGFDQVQNETKAKTKTNKRY